MPTSPTGSENGFTPSWRSAEHGFTLVELMVVVTIIGIAAGAVVLSLPEGSGRLRTAAEALAVDAAAVRDHAIIAGRATSVSVSPSGYAFAERRNGADAPIAERRFRPGHWPPGVVADRPQRLRFDPSGLVDPAAIRLSAGSEALTVRIAADGSVDVEG